MTAAVLPLETTPRDPPPAHRRRSAPAVGGEPQPLVVSALLGVLCRKKACGVVRPRLRLAQAPLCRPHVRFLHQDADRLPPPPPQAPPSAAGSRRATFAPGREVPDGLPAPR